MKQSTVGALLLVILAIALANSQQVDASEIVENAKSRFKLSNPFDFLKFKQVNHKSYDSPVEESSRMKIFLARCHQVFVSTVGFLRDRKKYFLKINERSDWTPKELEAAKNKFTISSMLQASGKLPVDNYETNNGREDPEKFGSVSEKLEEQEGPLVEPKGLADELEEKTKQEHDSKLLVEELDNTNLVKLNRRKRNIEGTRAKLSIEEALGVKSPEGSSSKQPGLKPRSERVDYTKMPGYKELHRRVVVRGDHEARSYTHLPVKSNYKKRGFVSTMTRMFKNQYRSRSDPKSASQADSVDLADPDDPDKPGDPAESVHLSDLKRPADSTKVDDGRDVVWVDFRKSGCLPPIRNQGICGSCYAFAAMAWLEWLHCSRTGERLKLSEQYLVDCGPQNQPGINGCSGSNFYRTAEFITNFGLELRQNYPYSGIPNQCPYEPGKKMDEMGFYRTDASDVLIVDMKFAELYLDKWPIMVEIHAAGDFEWYGGGVWDGKSCGHKSDHCVLIVGHGRENGEEYWLIRNSHGTVWGEQGYMKLNKNSKCIFLPQGYIFGTVNGKESNMLLERNVNVPESVTLKLSPMNSMLAKMNLVS